VSAGKSILPTKELSSSLSKFNLTARLIKEYDERGGMAQVTEQSHDKRGKGSVTSLLRDKQ
jgi:hypothetical protein